MRMWLVDPQLMCDRHLLGEHVEMHMFVGTIRKGVSIQGYLDGGLVEVDRIVKRHDQLVLEMQRRSMRHSSPLAMTPDEVNRFSPDFGLVDPAANLAALISRCSQCRHNTIGE